MTPLSQTSAYRRAAYAASEKLRKTAHEKGRRWRKNNPEKHKLQKQKSWAKNRNTSRNYWLKKKYGITLQQKADLLATQGGACKICHTTTPGKRGWATDHERDTKRVRGVLCNKCNLGLGHFDDSPDLLRAALNYLLPPR